MAIEIIRFKPPVHLENNIVPEPEELIAQFNNNKETVPADATRNFDLPDYCSRYSLTTIRNPRTKDITGEILITSQDGKHVYSRRIDSDTITPKVEQHVAPCRITIDDDTRYFTLGRPNDKNKDAVIIDLIVRYTPPSSR